MFSKKKTIFFALDQKLVRRHKIITAVVAGGHLLALIVVLTVSLFTNNNKQALAASYTWDGGGTTNNWSDCANWSSNICPVAADTVTFNSTSTKNSVVDSGFIGTVASLTIASGYTGEVSLERSLTINSAFVLGTTATFTAGDNSLSTSTFNVGNGIFNAPSSKLTVTSTFSITGGTFNHNNGTVEFAGSSATLACNNAIFNLTTFPTVTTGTKTIQSSCTLPIGHDPVINPRIAMSGVFVGTGHLNFAGAVTTFTAPNVLSGFGSLTVAGTFTNAAGAITDLSSYDPVIFNVFALSGGTFTAPTGTMTATNLNITGGNFIHNSGTISLVGSSSTIVCNNSNFNLIIFNHSAGTKTVSSDCTLPLGDNPSPSIPNLSAITLNGTLTGTGVLTRPGSTLTINTTGEVTGFSSINANALTLNGPILDWSAMDSLTVGSTFTANNGTTFISPAIADFNSTFTLNSGSSFTAPSDEMTVAGNFTNNAGATFNHNNGTLTFDSASASVITCNNAVFNLVTFNKTNASGDSTISSGCNMPLGHDPLLNPLGGSCLAGTSLSTSISLNGVLSGSGALSISPACQGPAFQIYSGGSLEGFNELFANSFGIDNANVSLATYDLVDVNAFSLTNAAVFTAPLVLKNGTTFTVSPGTTFNANGGTVIFDDSNTSTSPGTLACNNTAFNLVKFENVNSGAKVVSSDCSLPLGVNPQLGNGGSMSLNGSLTGSGTITAPGPSTLFIESGYNITGFSGLDLFNFTVNTDSDFSSYDSFNISGNYAQYNGKVQVPNGANFEGNLRTENPAEFVAPSETMNVAGDINTWSDSGLSLPGSAGNYASTPDSTSLSVTGDIDLIARVALNNWINHPNSSAEVLINKRSSSGPSATSYEFYVDNTGKLNFLHGSGTVNTVITSSASVGFVNSTTGWVRVTWRQSDGRVQFFTSSTNTNNSASVNWTQLGSDQIGPTTAISDNATELEAGSTFNGTAAYIKGKIYRTQVYDGIGGELVFDADFTNHASGTTSFTESSSSAATVTIHGGSSSLNEASSADFDSNGGTVVLDGGNQSINGEITFQNLIKTASSPAVLRFQNGLTQTIEGDLDFSGTAGNLLSLVSDQPGSQWSINSVGQRNLQYLSVQDSNNINVNAMLAYDSQDLGNNTNWEFLDSPTPVAPVTSGNSQSLGSSTLADTGINQQLIFLVSIFSLGGIAHLVWRVKQGDRNAKFYH